MSRTEQMAGETPDRPSVAGAGSRALAVRGLRGLCMLFACLSPLAATSSGCAKSAQKRAIAEIERLKGRFEIDEKASHQPLVKVDLSFTQATDTSLERLREVTTLQELHLCGTEICDAGLGHLRSLTNLQTLDLWRCKNFTDAGLRHLEGMTSLRELSLWNTEITDGGLNHLKGLISLQELDLSHTQITDAGLENLENLTSLRKLELIGCEALTEGGVDDLKRALPKVAVTR